MPPVLAALSELYVRYVAQYEHPGFLDSNRRPIVTFHNILHNAAFMLSHLTNQGIHNIELLIEVTNNKKDMCIYIAQVTITACV
jgi:hypothetical protein